MRARTGHILALDLIRDITISDSLMVYDIQALQYMYAANNDYNSGNTKYEFDPTRPNSWTIWDGGGEDLLDFSNFNYRCDIDLNDGAYSTIRYAGWNPEDNFGIAFNTFIENVSGSQSNDTIKGNELDNEISGNNGNDTLYGGAGNDVFDWASGSRGGTWTQCTAGQAMISICYVKLPAMMSSSS